MLGPRRDPDAQPERVDMDVAARVAAWGRAAEQARLRDPAEGFALGHDVGYSADTEHRGFVHGVIDGFEAGTQARRELADHLLSPPPPGPEPEPEAEPEAGLSVRPAGAFRAHPAGRNQRTSGNHAPKGNEARQCPL